MEEQTYRVVWRPFVGDPETLNSGLTAQQAGAWIARLPPLPPMGGSYGLEVEEPT